MGAVLALRPPEVLTVEPGQTTSCELNLANTGTIVEQFTIMVMGDAADWIHPEPPVVSLFPGAQQTVTLRFTPPRTHSTPAGEVPFAVKVIPSNEPEESVTEEGVVHVGSFNDIGAELLPRVATGRVAGRQKLAVDSRGNVPVPVAITALDGAEALKFSISPSKLITAPGEARFVRIRVKPRQRFWKGPQQQKPYKVQVGPEGETPIVLDGGLSQRAVLPKWVFWLVGAAAALVLLWFLILRPVVHNDAVNANKAALAAQAAQTKALTNQVHATQSSVASNSAAVAQVAAAQAKSSKTKVAPTTTTVPKPTTTTTTVAKKVVAVATAPTAPTTTTPTVPPPVTGPADGHLETVAAPGATAASAAPEVGTGSTLQVTDVVIENVSGSKGIARIERVIPGQPAQDLLVENLGDLTDQEFRFDTPMIFTHDQALQLRVDCQANQTACDVFTYYTGPLTQPQSATTTTIP